MKTILSLTALALVLVLANCDKKKEGDMPATETMAQEEAPAAATEAPAEDKAEESKE